MSSKVIPEQTIMTCDRCGTDKQEDFANGGTHAKKVNIWARGYDGAAGGITKDIDLCSNCSNKFQDFMSPKSQPTPTPRPSTGTSLRKSETPPQLPIPTKGKRINNV